MNGRRLGLALRAAVATTLVAATLELLFLLAYDPAQPYREFLALAIWTPLLGGFASFYALGLVGVLERGVRFSVLMALGVLGGFAWVFVATVPVGMWLTWLDTPVWAIWPISSAVGFAYAAPRPGRGVRPDDWAWAAALYGLLGLALFTWEVKLQLPEQMGPELRAWALGAVDPPRPARPTEEPSVPALGDAGAPVEAPCRDPAPPPLPQDPVVLDPSARPEPLGVFTDVRQTEVGGVAHIYGRTLQLWVVDGSLTGALASQAGPAGGPVHRGMLERARLDASSGQLSFEAYFEDGFFARFTGILGDGAVEGTVTIADPGCVGRILSTDRVTLARQESLPPTRGRSSIASLMAGLEAEGAFRRERPPR